MAFTCDVCSKDFSSQKVLARHRKIHTGVKKFSCAECKTDFSRMECLRRHRQSDKHLERVGRLNSGAGPSGQPAARPARQPAKRKGVLSSKSAFTCNTCNEGFETVVQLTQHLDASGQCSAGVPPPARKRPAQGRIGNDEGVMVVELPDSDEEEPPVKKDKRYGARDRVIKRRNLREWAPVTKDDTDAVEERHGREAAELYKQKQQHINAKTKHQAPRRQQQYLGNIIEFNVRIPPQLVSSQTIINYLDNTFANDILPKIGTQAKLQLSFGKILHVINEHEDRLKYFHPESMTLDKAEFIDRENGSTVISSIMPPESLEEKVMLEREDSQSKLVMLTNAKIKVFQMDRPIGCGHELGQFPDWLINKQALIDFTEDRRGDEEASNLCVFECIGYAIRKSEGEKNPRRRSLAHARRMVDRFIAYRVELGMGKDQTAANIRRNGLHLLKRSRKTVDGELVEWDTITQLENCFNVNLGVYVMHDEQPYADLRGREHRRPVLVSLHSSCGKHGGLKVNLLVNEETAHCVLITDMSKLSPSYSCQWCNKMFNRKYDLDRHNEYCKGASNYQYPGGFVKRPLTPFQKLEEFNIIVPEADRRNPHRAVFDIEAFERPVELLSTEKTETLATHTIASYSVVSNVNGFTDPHHECDDTLSKSRELCVSMIKYLERIKHASAAEWHRKMDPIYLQIQKQLIDLGGIPFIHEAQTTALPPDYRVKLQQNRAGQFNDRSFDLVDFKLQHGTVPTPQCPVTTTDENEDEDGDNVMAAVRQAMNGVNNAHRTNERQGNNKKEPYNKNAHKNPFTVKGQMSMYNEGRNDTDIGSDDDDEEARAPQTGQQAEPETVYEREMDAMLNDNGAPEPDINAATEEEAERVPLQRKKRKGKTARELHIASLMYVHDELRDYAKLSVLGFNSSKYDLNVIRQYIPEIVVGITADEENRDNASITEDNPDDTPDPVEADTEEEEDHVPPADGSDEQPPEAEKKKNRMIIKKGNSYSALETDSGLVFLDVKNYLPPGLSLSQTFAKYNTAEVKGYFPYSLLSNPEFYDSTVVPNYKDFDSTLKGYNTLEDEWTPFTKSLFVSKWRPIVRSVVLGLLSLSKVTEEEAHTRHLFYYEYMDNWMQLAEQMEPATTPCEKTQSHCSKCNELTDFLMPESDQCLRCYKQTVHEPQSQPCANCDMQRQCLLRYKEGALICIDCYNKVRPTTLRRFPAFALSEEERELTLRLEETTFTPTASRDDSYVQTNLWFLEQAGYCTGDYDDNERVDVPSRTAWLQKTDEERAGVRKQRHGNLWSSKRNTGIDNYRSVRKMWRRFQWTGREYLAWYNNLDVTPLLEVIEMMGELEWRHHRIDCMKGNISLPHIARLKVWKYAFESGYYFGLFSKKDEAEERKQRRTAYGGPSIVFNRCQLSGLTRLNNGEGNRTKVILGYDYNSLYPSTFLHNMPTGPCYLYKPDDETGEWKARCAVNQGSVKEFVWLECMNTALKEERWAEEEKIRQQTGREPERRRVEYLHSRNCDKVPRIGNYIPDGIRMRDNFLDWELRAYGPEIKGICIEMNGCYYHGHSCQRKEDDDDERKKFLNKCRRRTKKRRQAIEKLGYIYRDIWECQYDHLIYNSHAKLNLHAITNLPPYYKRIFNSTPGDKTALYSVFKDTEAVERLILNGSADEPHIFGFIEADVEDVEKRNDHFPLLFAPVEMDPRLHNPDARNPRAPVEDPETGKVDRDPLWEKQHPTLLTGVTKVVRGLFNTEYMRTLLKYGCKIRKVYSFQEYKPEKCFAELATELSRQRAQESDPNATQSDELLALNAKITANSIYGSLLLNKDHHSNVDYQRTGVQLCRKYNDPKFRDASYINDEWVEIVSAKRKITQDVPIQISKTVLDIAKMLMVEFTYDVLDRYIDRDDYQLFQMDTDSLYFGLAKSTFEECVKPEMREEYEERKASIFVQCHCSKKCTNPRCDKRKLGLMKLENKSTHAVALTSKTHVECDNDPLSSHGGTFVKTSAKGIPRSALPIDTFTLFHNVLYTREPVVSTMQMLRPKDNDMVRMRVKRTGVTSKYNYKRCLNEDNLHTTGLNVEMYAGPPMKEGGLFTPEFYLLREEMTQRNLRAIRQQPDDEQ